MTRHSLKKENFSSGHISSFPDPVNGYLHLATLREVMEAVHQKFRGVLHEMLTDALGRIAVVEFSERNCY